MRDWIARSMIIAPNTAHKMIAYFEEEAVRSYTEYLELISSGQIENVPAPKLAIEYYGMPESASLWDMVWFVRNDEEKHSKVNRKMAGF